ncbi:MAG: gamma-glutamyl-gamma-aminobutyrate hydrolase family protein [Actinomycetota bacterium]
MSATVGYVIHRPEWTESRIADVLRSDGHRVEFSCPAAGDPLPDLAQVDAVVVGGGPVAVYEADHHPFLAEEISWARRAVECERPFLGMCLGSQILAAAFGRTSIGRADRAVEFGFHTIEITGAGHGLLAGLSSVYSMHEEQVDEIPDGAELLATSETFDVQAFRLGRCAVGVQFHPDCREVDVPSWWRDADRYRGRPGAQRLADQVRDARRHDAAIQSWTERFVRRWITGDLPTARATASTIRTDSSADG